MTFSDMLVITTPQKPNCYSPYNNQDIEAKETLTKVMSTLVRTTQSNYYYNNTYQPYSKTNIRVRHPDGSNYHHPLGVWNITKNGMAYSVATGFYEGLSISFDTNGPFNGPNIIGYDIFKINRDSIKTNKYYSNGGGCSFTYTGQYNGLGCYEYAYKNQNPHDRTKKYWESLPFKM